MTFPDRRTGRCLCGAITLSATLTSPAINACHCAQCQRWTGGGPLSSVRVTDLDLDGSDQIAAYHASEWGERAFCRTCGTTLYWRMQGQPVAYLAIGLLDDQSNLAMTNEIFVDHRPPWLRPWPEAAQRTEAEEMAELDAFLKGETP